MEMVVIEEIPLDVLYGMWALGIPSGGSHENKGLRARNPRSTEELAVSSQGLTWCMKLQRWSEVMSWGSMNDLLSNWHLYSL